MSRENETLGSVKQLRFRRMAWRRTEGAQLLEFAIMLPVLLVLVVGAADFGAAFIKRDKLANAAREGARIAVVQSPADLTQANPLTVQSVRDAVLSYLNGAGLPATLSGTTPCAVGIFDWTYCLTNSGQIRIERQHVVNVNGTLVLCSRVTVTYPHTWSVAQILRLLVPSSSLSSPVMIPVDAVMKNLT